MGYYEDRLKGLIDQPGSYQATPGFTFARDQGLEAINRNNSATRGSGNVLAELTKYATGLASQDYGNTRDFLGRMTGQDQQFQLGTEQNRLAGEQNDLTRQRDIWSNENTQRGQGMDFGLGMLRETNGNDYNRARLALEDRNSGQDTALNWFRAQTDRGTARSNAANAGDTNSRNWYDRFFA